MDSVPILDIEMGKSVVVRKLLAFGIDDALLIGRVACLALDLSLQVMDGVLGLDIEGPLVVWAFDENSDHADTWWIFSSWLSSSTWFISHTWLIFLFIINLFGDTA